MLSAANEQGVVEVVLAMLLRLALSCHLVSKLMSMLGQLHGSVQSVYLLMIGACPLSSVLWPVC